MVGQVNGEYETRDKRKTKYVSLVNLRLGSFIAWQLEHALRDSNEKADALIVMAASLPIKETVLIPVYYQPKSSITTNWVNEIDEACPSWMNTLHLRLELCNCNLNMHFDYCKSFTTSNSLILLRFSCCNFLQPIKSVLLSHILLLLLHFLLSFQFPATQQIG